MELKILQLLLFLCMKLLVSAEIRCIESERQALLKFSGNLNELTWGSEKDKGDCCNWDGVGCTDTGNVFSLDLSGMYLRGKINPALRELRYLKYLYLTNNDLTIDNLNWLSDISSLSYLHLSGVNLKAVTNWLQPIAKLSSLVELYLSSCQLHNPLSAFDVFANSSLSSLSTLDLSHNELTSISTFDLMFNFSRTLIYLDLSGNQLKRLPKFDQLFNLKSLYFSSNSLEGTIIEHHLANLTQLRALDLSSNSLEGTITEHHLGNLTHLKKLDLSFNNVSFNLSIDWVPTFQLKIIRLSHCIMGPYFPNWIQKQNSLRELALSFAAISDTLPNWLWNMSSIQHLDLSHNNITGGMLDLTLHFYEILDLSYNNLSGPIPLSVFRYSGDLRLSNNLLSGSIFNLCTISGLLPLQALILSDNQLGGELPDCWMNISGLNILDLANNKLSGKIPPTLSTLSSLLILRLGNNNFTGGLSSCLKTCTMLRKLDVGGNKLTGKIPAWIGTHLRSLAVLSLRFNSFHGSIPPTICYLTVVHVLDLSRNNIHGKIPRCLNNFTILSENDGSTLLGDKLFEGQPVEDDDNDNALVQWKGQELEYKRLKNMKGIDLSSNKLVGTIPQAFSELKGLVFINLSRNHLTGNIISSIGQLDTLEWLDLSRNQLSGEIPNGLANLHFLSVLDLSYNNLMGKIPLSTQLQSFDSTAYIGNIQLCGDPLAECPHDPSVNDLGKVTVVREDHTFINRDFYICMLFGFITGFWIVVGTLVLKHSWRHSYFKFLNNIGDWMYVTTTIYMTRFKSNFMP